MASPMISKKCIHTNMHRLHRLRRLHSLHRLHAIKSLQEIQKLAGVRGEAAAQPMMFEEVMIQMGVQSNLCKHSKKLRRGWGGWQFPQEDARSQSQKATKSRVNQQEAKKPRIQEAEKPRSQEAKKPKSQEAEKPRSQEAKSEKKKTHTPPMGKGNGFVEDLKNKLSHDQRIRGV